MISRVKVHESRARVAGLLSQKLARQTPGKPEVRLDLSEKDYLDLVFRLGQVTMDQIKANDVTGAAETRLLVYRMEQCRKPI